MIKNIPNKFSKKQLLELLDSHCFRENQKIQELVASPAEKTLSSEFDFLYLPMDFTSGNNLGYAFVNFSTAEAARRLHRELHSKPWNSFGSRKVCEITYAKIQGLARLLRHFRSSIFTCSSADYLPVFFKPSRDGVRRPSGQLIGTLVDRQYA
ncbi:Protein terminal ear1 like [Apostasia shenzhenica]|uniref:Protein terminal ear1 like n=1 Tax=Apostasia shenzhenica TaxID=1088818 RepID=A0A2I0B8R5_9ASPA|nr:Protein terminal ear1 like [Apostasia shenzhenica]